MPRSLLDTLTQIQLSEATEQELDLSQGVESGISKKGSISFLDELTKIQTGSYDSPAQTPSPQSVQQAPVKDTSLSWRKSPKEEKGLLEKVFNYLGIHKDTEAIDYGERAKAGIQLEAKGLISQAEKPLPPIPTSKYINTINPQGKNLRTQERWMKDIEAGALGTVEGLAGFTQWITNDKIGKGLSDHAERWRKDLLPDDPNLMDDMMSGVGSMASFFIPGLGVSRGMQTLWKVAPRLAQWSGATIMGATEAAVEAGSVYRDMLRSSNGDIEKASKAATTTFWLNLPLIVVTDKLGYFGEKGKLLRRKLVSGLIEGGQEGGQEIISKAAKGEDIKLKDLVSPMAVGGALGLVFGGAGDIRQGNKPATDIPPPTTDIPPPTAPPFRRRPSAKSSAQRGQLFPANPIQESKPSEIVEPGAIMETVLEPKTENPVDQEKSTPLLDELMKIQEKEAPKVVEETDQKPTAEFLGYQEQLDEPPIPLFNVKGGRLDGSTVSVDTLKENGIEVPETPLEATPKEKPIKTIKAPRKRPSPEAYTTTRSYIRALGGLNPNEPSYKGEIRDATKGAKWGGYILNKKTGLNIDQLMTIFREDPGWAQVAASEETLLDAIINNSPKPIAADDVEGWMKSLTEEEKIFHENATARINSGDFSPEQLEEAKRAVQEDFKKEIKNIPGAKEEGADDVLTSLDKAFADYDKKAKDKTFKLTPTEPTAAEKIALGRMKGTIGRGKKSPGQKNVIPTEKIKPPTSGKQDSIFKDQKDQTKDMFDEKKDNPDDGESKLSIKEPSSSEKLADIDELPDLIESWLKEAGAYDDVMSEIDVERKPLIDIKGKNIKMSLDQYGKKDVNSEDVMGMTTFKNMRALIELSLNANNIHTMRKTTYHEYFHVAAQWLLPKGEYDSLIKQYGNEEKAANAFADFMWKPETTKARPSFINRIFQKIKDMLASIKRGLNKKGYTKAEDIFASIKKGEYKMQPGRLYGKPIGKASIRRPLNPKDIPTKQDRIPGTERKYKEKSISMSPEEARGLGPGEIVKHRRWLSKTKSENAVKPILVAPAVRKKDLDIIEKIRELKPSLFNRWLENPIRTFEWLGEEVKELFYRPITKAHKAWVNDTRAMHADLVKVGKGIGAIGSKRIMIYAVGQQAKGLEILKYMGVNPVNSLNPREMTAYNALRERYEVLFEKLQEARKAAGVDPFPKVDNYFTFFRNLGMLEKMGFNPSLMKAEKINKMFSHFKATPFRFAKARTKMGMLPVELDAFAVFNKYATSAYKHIHYTPAIAQLREYLGNFGRGDEAWKLEDVAPRTAKWLTDWIDFQAGQRMTGELPPNLERGLLYLNNNVVVALLSGTLRSVAIQPSSLMQATVEIGPIHIAKGIAGLVDLKMRKFAMDHSNHLPGRDYDVHTMSLSQVGYSLKPRHLKQTAAKAGTLGLQMLDMETAMATWIGSYSFAQKELDYSQEKAVNFADDIVVKTQASAASHDIAPIQRTAIGKLITPLQTFVINEWGWTTRDTFGIGRRKDSKKSKEIFRKILTLIAMNTLFNILYEDVLNMPSPLPTPIRAFREALEDGESIPSASWQATKELGQKVPIVGGSIRFSKSFLGATYETLENLITGRKKVETVARLAGVPGTGQIAKIARAKKHGGTTSEAMFGSKRFGKKKDNDDRNTNALRGLKGMDSNSLKGLD